MHKNDKIKKISMESDYNQEMSFSDDCLRTVNLGDKIIEKQLSSGAYKHVSCNVCGSDDPIVFAVDYHGEPHKRRVKCKKCGLVYSDSQATKSKLKNYYETYNNSVKTIEEIIQLHESLVSQYNRIFSTLTNKSKGGRFLDVGVVRDILLMKDADMGGMFLVLKFLRDMLNMPEKSSDFQMYDVQIFSMLNIRIIILIMCGYGMF